MGYTRWLRQPRALVPLLFALFTLGFIFCTAAPDSQDEALPLGSSTADIVREERAADHGSPDEAFISPCDRGAKDNLAFTLYNKTGRAMACGRRFAPALGDHLKRLRIADSDVYKLAPIEADQVAFVTYASSNHFGEARKFITSLRAQLNNTIVFYDLGLTESELAELRGVCHLIVRRLDASLYPAFALTHLTGYHFKAIVMAEVYHEFAAFWIVDSSIRFRNLSGNLDRFNGEISSGKRESLMMALRTGHSVYAATHPKMYEYLPAEAPERLPMAEAHMFIARSPFSREAVKWYLLCALTEDCMNPPGSALWCKFGKDRFTEYAHCHRYDQSAMNIIVASLLARDHLPRRVEDNADMLAAFMGPNRGDKQSAPLRAGQCA